MKVLFLAMALLNAPADEQELMVSDLYAVDPAWAVDLLDGPIRQTRRMR